MARAACLAAVLVGPNGCAADCDRAGCEATERPADPRGIDQGVAGAVSSESDVVANGCQECTLSQATLQIWAASVEPADKDAVVALINTFPPIEVVDVDETYAVALDVGDYAICQVLDDGVCAVFTIGDGEVATVHLQARYGPSDMVVFDPGQDSPRESGIFRLEPGDAPPGG